MMFKFHADARSLMMEMRHVRFLKSCLCPDMKYDDILHWEVRLRDNIAADLKELEVNPTMALLEGDAIDNQMMALLLLQDLVGPEKPRPKPSKIPIRIQQKRPSMKTPTSKIPRPVKARPAEEKRITDNIDAVGQTMQKTGAKAQGNAAKPRWHY